MIHCLYASSQRVQVVLLSQLNMKLLLLLLIATTVLSLPYVEQITLANSLIVGREDESDLVNWECKVCDGTNRPIHTHYIHEKVKDIKCVLSVYPNFIVLAFRYTNTALNVWQDILYANQIPDEHTCSTCKVQKAYNNMWESIKLEVIADLRAIQTQTKLNSLYITGISMGGGLSVLSFIDLNEAKIFSFIRIITYGAPRVGNKDWAAHFEKITSGTSKRFIVKGDPIVVLPSCLTILCNYKQTGIQYVCTEADNACRTGLPVPEKLEERVAWLHHRDPSMKRLGSIMDHVDGYPKIYNSTVIEG